MWYRIPPFVTASRASSKKLFKMVDLEADIKIP